MNLGKILFVLSLLGILFLLLFSKISQKEQMGTIESIQYSENKITIYLENSEIPLIIFDNKILTLKKGDKIKFIGKDDLYKNKPQIIVDRISALPQINFSIPK